MKGKQTVFSAGFSAAVGAGCGCMFLAAAMVVAFVLLVGGIAGKRAADAARKTPVVKTLKPPSRFGGESVNPQKPSHNTEGLQFAP
jgi:hypothetical protein